MPPDDLAPFVHRHDHAAEPSRGERRTRWVVGITLATMVSEILAGTWFGSMALLADGWRMGTHAAALGVAVFAYPYGAFPDLAHVTVEVNVDGGAGSPPRRA